MTRRDIYFALFMLLTAAAFLAPLADLVKLSLANDAYSHLVVIPIVSGVVIFLDRKRIFSRAAYSPLAGAAIISAGLACAFASRGHWLAPAGTSNLTLMALAMVLVWTGCFAACYGTRALRAAAFPWLFLWLMIPLPGFVLSRIVYTLQKGSADVTYAIFQLTGVPVLRDGFVFSLPGLSIEVARECSGIRSCEALVITSLLAGYVFLRSGWRKLFFTVMVVPVAIVKNAIRIAAIALLSAYVNRGFLFGRLHHDGGIPFSMISVAMLVPLLWWLYKSERRLPAPQPQPEAAEVSAAR